MSIISVKKYCVKGYRRISHRKGYGVHSPFVYTLITRVIEEDAAYYAYGEIEKTRDTVKSRIHNKNKNPLISGKTAKLLFRLVNRFKPCHILECGTSYGVSTAAIKLAAPSAQISVIEADEQRRTCLGQNNTAIYGGTYETEIPLICREGKSPDFIYIREHPEAEDYDKIFTTIKTYISDKTIIMAEGMHKTSDIYHLFCKLAEHDKIKVFMDMYDTALYIASPKLNKERYKESF